jgi:hypothetical protein
MPISTKPLSNKSDSEKQQFLAYKRPMSSIEISIGLGWRSGRRFTKPVAIKKRQEWQHISDKVDCKPTLIKWDKEWQSILIKREIDQRK